MHSKTELALRLQLEGAEAKQMNSREARREGRIAEISGWDAEENFFVEKAFLQEDGDGNRADLRARLRVGSLVFVRMIEEHSMRRAVPVTYKVSSIGLYARNEEEGASAREVEMIRLRPREATMKALLEFTFRETPVN